MRGENATPIKIDDYIDALSSDVRLDDIEAGLESHTNKNMLLYLWMVQNNDLLQQYGYILIDCHPDFQISTKNAIVVSHAIFSLITPNQFSFDSRTNLRARLRSLQEEVIDYRTGESYVTDQLLFILNRLRHNTKTSHQLIELMQDKPNVIAEIPDRELFNRSTLVSDTSHTSTPIIDIENDPQMMTKYRSFFTDINQIFDHLRQVVDQIDD